MFYNCFRSLVKSFLNHSHSPSVSWLDNCLTLTHSCFTLSPILPYLFFLLIIHRLIVLGFNDMSTLVGHFVSSPREREKRDRSNRRRDEKEGQGTGLEWKWRNRINKNTFSPLPLPATRIASQYQLDAQVTWNTRHLRSTRPPPINYPSIMEHTICTIVIAVYSIYLYDMLGVRIHISIHVCYR